MLSVIHSTSHSPHLLSSVLSSYYPASHSNARLALMKCIGEAVHCWDEEYIQNRHDDIVRVILAGLKDRTGDVRDASRLVLCLLYCKLLPSNPAFIHDAELTEAQRESPTERSHVVTANLRLLLSDEQLTSMSPAALDLIRSELAHMHAVAAPYSR